MMGRMNMGKQIAEAPSSKGVKKMMGGGMASMTPSMFGKGSKSGRGPSPAPGGAAGRRSRSLGHRKWEHLGQSAAWPRAARSTAAA